MSHDSKPERCLSAYDDDGTIFRCELDVGHSTHHVSGDWLWVDAAAIPSPARVSGETAPVSESRPDAQGGPSAEQQLVHSARESILARWAKYSDPKNSDWEFEAASRWERHAINAVLDLVRVEASERSLREQLSRVSEERDRIAKELSSLQGDK